MEQRFTLSSTVDFCDFKICIKFCFRPTYQLKLYNDSILPKTENFDEENNKLFGSIQLDFCKFQKVL